VGKSGTLVGQFFLLVKHMPLAAPVKQLKNALLLSVLGELMEKLLADRGTKIHTECTCSERERERSF